MRDSTKKVNSFYHHGKKKPLNHIVFATAKRIIYPQHTSEASIYRIIRSIIYRIRVSEYIAFDL